MKRSVKVTILSVFIVFLVAGCIGGYRMYQRYYLSSDLRRTLTAAMDESATEADIQSYLRTARLQIRTKKDTNTVRDFEECLALAKDAAEISRRHWKESLESIAASGPYGKEYKHYDDLIDTVKRYWSAGRETPKELSAEIHQESQRIKTEREQKEKRYKSEEETGKQESAKALSLLNGVRATLKMPPIPKPKE